MLLDKISKHRKPKIIRFVIKINRKILRIGWIFKILYSSFRISKNLQLGTNVTWHDAYYQQHDEFLKIESIFNYQMPYRNTKKMIDSIYSKSKPLHLINIWNDNINNEANDSRLAILILNTINIEPYDLWFDFVI